MVNLGWLSKPRKTVYTTFQNTYVGLLEHLRSLSNSHMDPRFHRSAVSDFVTRTGTRYTYAGTASIACPDTASDSLMASWTVHDTHTTLYDRIVSLGPQGDPTVCAYSSQFHIAATHRATRAAHRCADGRGRSRLATEPAHRLLRRQKRR